MNRSSPWSRISLALLSALVVPILAACGGSPQAALPTAAPAASASAPTTAAPVGNAMTAPTATSASGLNKINHVVVIVQENWSFDSLYGEFPGANGIANAGETVRQLDKQGQPYKALPQPIDTNKKPAAPDPRFPPDLPVQPVDAGVFCRA